MPVISELEAITVAWEPCAGFDDDHDAIDGRCITCGWAPDDHDVARSSAA